MGRIALNIISLILLLLMPFFGKAQEVSIADSLKARLNTASSDLEKADIEMKICKYYLGIFPDSVERHANNAIRIYTLHNLIDKKVDATLILAHSYQYKGVFDQAIYCIKGLLEEIKANKNELLLGKCYHFMGELCRATTLYESAILYLKNGLKIGHEHHDKNLAANCYDRLAAVNYEKTNYWQTIIYADSALEISRKQKYYEITASSLDILGAVYTTLGQFDKALTVQTEALDVCSLMDAPETILPNVYRNIARTYYRQKDLDKALEFANISYKMAEKSKIWVYMDISAGLLSRVYAEKGNYKKAYEFSEISMGIRTATRDKEIAYKITELNARYENAKKERLIADQDNKLYQNQLQMLKDKTRLQIMLFASITLITLIIVLVIFYIQKRRNHMKMMLQNHLILEKNVEMEQLTKEVTLQASELRKTNEELLKLTSFKVFMTNMMVHDLKNPLNSIIGFSEFHPDDAHFSYINHSAKGMLHLVSNILDIQKYERSEMQVLKQKQSVARALHHAVEEVKIALEMRELKIIIRIDESLEANFDSEIINRVLINLLTNAVKYSHKNSSITLTGNQETINGKNYVKVSVHNEGDPIPVDKLEKIFDEFSDINARKLGVSYSTGLGLTFCRIAVKAHNGEMGVESAENLGTTFWFTLEA
jgi:signal transduction histidine kinase